MISFSEFLAKSQRSATEPTAISVTGASNKLEKAFDLKKIPVDTAEIRPESRIVMVTDPRSPGADRFRFLRMRLRELKAQSKLRSVVITSALPEDGKSTVALNLATVLAEGGKRDVLLIDADLYRPSLAKGLGIATHPGLAECLEDGLDPMLALRRIEPLHWNLLQSGEPRGNPTELLQSVAITGILQTLSSYFDWVLIDTPPVAPLSDALALSRHVDGSLLVVRADRTPREAVDDALRLLGPKQTLGIVLNGAESLNQAYSKYSGYYGKK